MLLKVAVPVKEALVVASYCLFTPESPDIVNPYFETVLEAVATSTVVAPELVNTMLPEYGLPAKVAVDCSLTYIVVLESVPALPTVIGAPLFPTLLEKLEVVETSNPDGGVIRTPAVKAEPDKEKLVGVALADP